MNNFLKEKIIIPSWDMIKDDSNAKSFYFIPWILSIIFLTVILVYQTIYTYVEIFWKKDIVLKKILTILETKIWIEILIILWIFLFWYFILVPIFDAWLIKYVDRKFKNNPLTKSEAFWQWIYKFLQIFEYSNFFSPFKILSILNAYLFIIRLIWIEYLKITSYVFLIILLFGLLINILFSYTKFFIILEDKKIFEGIWESIKLSILNPKITIKLFFIIFILNLRVIFNFIIFLIFPILIVSALTYISIKFLLIITIIILSIIFLWLIIFLWYLTAVLEIFNISLWYHAYIHWKEKSKN